MWRLELADTSYTCNVPFHRDWGCQLLPPPSAVDSTACQLASSSVQLAYAHCAWGRSLSDAEDA